MSLVVTVRDDCGIQNVCVVLSHEERQLRLLNPSGVVTSQPSVTLRMCQV